MSEPEAATSAEATRQAFAARTRAPGHAVDNARAAMAILDAAFAAGTIERTPALDAMLGDLSRALDAGEGERLGGKSAEASRLILRAIERELAREA